MEWSGIHRTIADALNNHRAFWWHTPNEGARRVRQNPKTGKWYCPEGARLKAMGMRKGAPDFFILKNCILHGLEVKERGRKPTPEQIAFGQEIIANGGRWAWSDDIDDALRILDEWGVISLKRPLFR